MKWNVFHLSINFKNFNIAPGLRKENYGWCSLEQNTVYTPSREMRPDLGGGDRWGLTGLFFNAPPLGQMKSNIRPNSPEIPVGCKEQ